MANMEIQGKIIKIGPVQTVGQNGFQRRDVVIMTEDQYPQYIPFDFVQEKCSLLDNFHEGQVVLISFNVRGREWVNPQGETKYIVNLQGWRIQDAMAAAQAAPQGYGQPAYPPQGYAQYPHKGTDSLPIRLRDTHNLSISKRHRSISRLLLSPFSRCPKGSH